MKSNFFYMQMFTWMFITYGSVSVSFAAPAPIITSTQDRADAEDNSFGIGLTSSIAQRPFVGVDDQRASLIYLSYRYKRFYIEGLDIGFNVLKDKTYSLDVVGTPRFYEVEPAFADNGELDGIDQTKRTYLGGLSAQIKTNFAVYTVQLLHDLVESDGNELVGQASKALKLNSDFTLTPSIGLVYQDSNLVDHFYGVQSHEVTVGRSQYSGKGSINVNATLHSSWNITKHIELLGQLKYEVLGDGITDSPIVDEESIYSFTLGAVYRF